MLQILHKLVAKTRTDDAKLDPSTMPTEFEGYSFTGTLRPYQKTARRTVPREISRPGMKSTVRKGFIGAILIIRAVINADYADNIQGKSISEERDRRTNNTIRIYTPDEIEGIRRACVIGREVLDIVGNAVAVGVTCDELDRIVSN